MQRERDLSQAFIELADTLVNHFDVLDFLHVLTLRSVELLEVDAAGVLLSDGANQLRVMAASTEQVRLLELFELQNEEGPCLECYTNGAPTFEEDLDSTERWPRFRTEALTLGFRSVEAIPMRLRDEVIGALNLFRRSTGRLSERDRGLSQALADVATIGLLQERAISEERDIAQHLQTALNNRVVIEQAKGVLAVHAGVAMEEAFELMRGYARNRNLRIPDVARDLIAGKLTAGSLQTGLQR